MNLKILLFIIVILAVAATLYYITAHNLWLELATVGFAGLVLWFFIGLAAHSRGENNG